MTWTLTNKILLTHDAYFSLSLSAMVKKCIQMTIWIKSRFYIAEFLLNFADPPYARVCIETYIKLYLKDLMYRPHLMRGSV